MNNYDLYFGAAFQIKVFGVTVQIGGYFSVMELAARAAKAIIGPAVPNCWAVG